MFFSTFPKTSYEIEIKDKKYTSKDVVNILTAFNIQHRHIDRSFFLRKHVISDRETPESISKDLYGEEKYWWTVLIINNTVNPYTEWVMDNYTIEKYVLNKYVEGLYHVHHFFDVKLDRVCDDVDDRKYRLAGAIVPANVTPVTNFQYEIDENEKRRHINVISPDYIYKFLDEFEKMIEEQVNGSN